MKKFAGIILALLLVLCTLVASAEYAPRDTVTVTFTMSSQTAAVMGASVNYNSNVLEYKTSRIVNGFGSAGSQRFSAFGSPIGTVTVEYTFQIAATAQPGSYTVSATKEFCKDLEENDVAGTVTGGKTIVISTACKHTNTKPVGEAKVATCTEDGITAGKKCATCLEVLEPQQVIPATGHTEKIIPAVAPTCTEKGITEGKVCTVCNAVLVEAKFVDPKGHTAGAEATCTTAQTCTVCKAELAPAKGHTAGAAATCTTAQTCTVCKAELAPALGHTAGDAATCTAPQTCTVCKAVLAPAKGHTAGAAATCTEAQTCTECKAVLVPAVGHKAGAAATCTTAQTCTVCKVELAAALGHKPGAAATCTVAQTCTVCKAELAAALGHKDEKIAAVAPTCTKTGLTEGTKCSVCKEILKKQEIVPELGHKPGAAATCTTAQTCTVCKAELVAALGHKDEKIAAVAPTCTKTGLTEGTKCSVCKEILKKQEIVPELGHTAGAAATCTTAQTCTVCKAELAPALGHKEAEIPAVAPTCTKTGLTAGVKCSVCDEILKKQEIVPALGHTAEVLAAVAPTCTKTGLTEGAKCSVCEATLVAQEVVPALGHTNEVIPAVAPTCTKTGLTEGTKCSVCDEILVAQKEVAALGHTNEVIPAVAPTCTETGLTEGTKCSVCGEILVAQKEVAAKGHEFRHYYSLPSTEAAGYQVHECNVCGYYYATNYVARLSADLGTIIFNAQGEAVEYKCTQDKKGLLTLTAAADADGAYTARKLFVTVELVKELEDRNVETILFVVGDNTLEISMDVFAQDEVVAAVTATAAGYLFTVDGTAVNAEGVAECLVKMEIVDIVDQTKVVEGVELITVIAAEDLIDVTETVKGLKLA